eukprot:gene12227-20418_t
MTSAHGAAVLPTNRVHLTAAAPEPGRPVESPLHLWTECPFTGTLKRAARPALPTPEGQTLAD